MPPQAWGWSPRRYRYIDGVPNTTIQVANWKDTSQAAIQKPKGAEQQRINAGERFAMTLVRFKGGTFALSSHLSNGWPTTKPPNSILSATTVFLPFFLAAIQGIQPIQKRPFKSIT